MYYVKLFELGYTVEHLFVDASNVEQLESKLLKHLGIQNGSLLMYDSISEQDYDGQISNYGIGVNTRYYFNLEVVEVL